MSEAVELKPDAAQRARLLVVDDDLALLKSMARTLSALGYTVETAANGRLAADKLRGTHYDCIISDISMPEMNGIQLLGAVREHDFDVPVIIVTGEPSVDTAVQALQYGALHYLSKPVDFDELGSCIQRGVKLHSMAKMKRQAMEMLGADTVAGDRAGLEASFSRTMDKLWMAYQPIVRASDQTVFGYEALLRSDEKSLPHPGAIIDAAERLDKLDELGRRIRDHAAPPIAATSEDTALFVNLHPRDLLDGHLCDPEAPLTAIANQVVLEITERTALDTIKDVRHRVADLRALGFRIAIDDLGSGYAGLNSFATLEPEIVKLDMTLIRDIDTLTTKQKLVGSMTALCKDMGMMVVAEGVETVAERDTVIGLGCDLLQGYLLAKPGRPFPPIVWK